MVKVLNYALTNIPSLRYVILYLITIPFEAVRLVEGILNQLKTQWTSTDMSSSLSHHFLLLLSSKLFYPFDSFSFDTFDYLIGTEKHSCWFMARVSIRAYFKYNWNSTFELLFFLLRKVKLMFFNKTEDDIIWRSQLEKLAFKDKRY